MANRLLIPFLNATKWVQMDPALFPQYAKKQFDEALFVEQFYTGQQQTCYPQKISIYDVYSYQFESNYDPLAIQIIDKDGAVYLDLPLQRVRRNTYQPDYYIYEVDINFTSLTPGFYWMKLVTGVTGMPSFISEPIRIINNIDSTVLIEYANSSYYGDVVWETGITMSFRVEGAIWRFNPASKDVLYEDQVLNETILSSQPYRTFTLFIGNQFGVPDWLIDKVNRILGCDNLRIDGKFFSKAEGAKWEKKEEDDYPMSGWSIELREQLNRNSAIFDNESPDNKKLLVVHNIESKGFGDLSLNAGSNIITITDLE
jgi:hypothetical protein